MSKYILQDLSVAVVDDQALLLEGFRSLLLSNGTGHVEAFDEGQQLLRRMTTRLFDVYIVDIDLHDMGSVDLIDRLRKAHANARIVVNTVHDEVWLVRQLLEKKVNAVLYKTRHAEEVVEAIDSVMNGRQYLSPEFKRAVDKIPNLHDLPTLREIDILRALAKGFTSKQIAEQLFISENTVEAHRKNLFFKLKARNIADLIVKAIAQGYIDPVGLLE